MTTSGALFKLITTVGNAENVVLEVNPSAVATVEQLKEVVTQIETYCIPKANILSLAECKATTIEGEYVADAVAVKELASSLGTQATLSLSGTTLTITTK